MAFTVNRIDHVVLNCRDVDATANWYVRVLGMRREVFGDGRVALRFGNRKKIDVAADRSAELGDGHGRCPRIAGPLLHCRDEP